MKINDDYWHEEHFQLLFLETAVQSAGVQETNNYDHLLANLHFLTFLSFSL